MTIGNRWLERDDVPRGAAYDARFTQAAAAGQWMHGEADRVMTRRPATVLDAGCGTGRVAIELARRGVDVVGVDLDGDMLAQARAKAPDLDWILADLADLDLGRTFDVVLAAGNVMVFLAEASERRVVERLAAHVADAGVLISGFQLKPDGLTLARYDECCAAAGLRLVERDATWDGEPFVGGDYAVSVHAPA